MYHVYPAPHENAVHAKADAPGDRGEGENGEGPKDVPQLDPADVMAMPIALDVMEEFARCEASKVLESVNASRPTFSYRLAAQPFVRGGKGTVRVGYISVIDACRVHSSCIGPCWPTNNDVMNLTVQAQPLNNSSSRDVCWPARRRRWCLSK